jgi:7TMR-DISM extracellular 2
MKRPNQVLRCDGLTRWLLAMALTLLSCAGLAAEPLRLSDDQASFDLWPAVTLLSDPEHSLDERSVLTRLADFRPPPTPHANLGVRRDTVWLRVPIAVPASERGRWVLDIDYASLDHIDVFVVSDAWRHNTTVWATSVSSPSARCRPTRTPWRWRSNAAPSRNCCCACAPRVR